MSTADASLPVIDFSKIIGPSISKSPEVLEESEKEKQRLYRAFIDVGFVYLENHSVPDFARENLFAHARQFFALPVSEKAKVETGESKAFHGWFSPQRTSGDTQFSDQKEAFDPENWPEFRDDMNFFFEKCHLIHLVLLRVLAQQVGINENFFEPLVDKKHHFFRIIYYPETTRESFKDRLRASAHTDYGTLTLLFNDNSGGLQVRHANGQYIDAPPIPGCAIQWYDRFILESAWGYFYGVHAHSNDIVGDLLSCWFNDTLRSTEHRVVEPAPKPDFNGEISESIPARYSVAWFGHPNRDALVEPVNACCTLENPKKYDPVYARQHVVERLAYLHKKARTQIVGRTACNVNRLQLMDIQKACPTH